MVVVIFVDRVSEALLRNAVVAFAVVEDGGWVLVTNVDTVEVIFELATFVVIIKVGVVTNVTLIAAVIVGCAVLATVASEVATDVAVVKGVVCEDCVLVDIPGVGVKVVPVMPVSTAGVVLLTGVVVASTSAVPLVVVVKVT